MHDSPQMLPTRKHAHHTSLCSCASCPCTLVFILVAYTNPTTRHRARAGGVSTKGGHRRVGRTSPRATAGTRSVESDCSRGAPTHNHPMCFAIDSSRLSGAGMLGERRLSCAHGRWGPPAVVCRCSHSRHLARRRSCSRPDSGGRRGLFVPKACFLHSPMYFPRVCSIA